MIPKLKNNECLGILLTPRLLGLDSRHSSLHVQAVPSPACVSDFAPLHMISLKDNPNNFRQTGGKFKKALASIIH